jgi:hypothetical protein
MCRALGENDAPLGAMRRSLRAQISVEIVENTQIGRPTVSENRRFGSLSEFGYILIFTGIQNLD